MGIFGDALAEGDGEMPFPLHLEALLPGRGFKLKCSGDVTPCSCNLGAFILSSPEQQVSDSSTTKS
jgi:hypothetical protein